MTDGQVTVDFVARDQPHGGWALILVEQEPWDTVVISDQLRRIQDRLYGCLEAALDGSVVAGFQESRGKPLVIRLDAFEIPEPELRDFFRRFVSEVPKLPDYAEMLRSQRFFPPMSFELNIEAL
jgi:hypothetical protein